jgi:peptide/nickel transport system permease protein
MISYIVRRLVQSLFVMIGVTIIVFIILHLLPGGPAKAILGPKASQIQIHNFIVENGYDKPVWRQYIAFIGRLLHGNLGYSFGDNQTVDSLIGQALPKSALLVGLAYVVSLVIAVPLGILQAVRRNKPIDYFVTVIAFVGYSMPEFWLGILLISGLAVAYPIFPSSASQGDTVSQVLTQPSGLVLPVATMTIVTVALFSRFMRSSAVDTLVQEHIRTARAKGVSEFGILRRHVLRNSLIPIITLIGLSLPSALAGDVIVESVFNYPGMGLLFWKAATTHSYNVLLGVTIVVGLATVLGNLLADVVYSTVDPRVRYS